MKINPADNDSNVIPYLCLDKSQNFILSSNVEAQFRENETIFIQTPVERRKERWKSSGRDRNFSQSASIGLQAKVSFRPDSLRHSSRISTLWSVFRLWCSKNETAFRSMIRFLFSIIACYCLRENHAHHPFICCMNFPCVAQDF